MESFLLVVRYLRVRIRIRMRMRTRTRMVMIMVSEPIDCHDNDLVDLY